MIRVEDLERVLGEEYAKVNDALRAEESKQEKTDAELTELTNLFPYQPVLYDPENPNMNLYHPDRNYVKTEIKLAVIEHITGLLEQATGVSLQIGRPTEEGNLSLKDLIPPTTTRQNP